MQLNVRIPNRKSQTPENATNTNSVTIKLAMLDDVGVCVELPKLAKTNIQLADTIKTNHSIQHLSKLENMENTNSVQIKLAMSEVVGSCSNLSKLVKHIFNPPMKLN